MKSAIAVVLAGAVAASDVHPERAAQIAEIQNTPGVLWQAAAHPRFASQAPGASMDMMGVKGDQKQAVADMVKTGEIVELLADSNAALPESFDSETNWPQCAKIIGDIRDQSNCGCCWAFAGAEAASDRMCIATNATKMVPLSAQDVCFNGGGFMSQGCGGGQITSPWSYMKKGRLFGGKGAVSGGQYQGSGPFGKGMCSDFSLPHCHHHGPVGKDPYPAEGAPGCPSEKSPSGPKACDADAAAPHNTFADDKYTFEGDTVKASGEDGIKAAIMAGGPMEVAFSVYSDFENYAGGVYHHVTGSQVGGHAVKVVGWGTDSGTKYWKIANSWNPYWGEKGYFRIKINDGSGIEDQAIGSSPTAKWSRAGDKVEALPPAAKKIEELFCKVASSKMIEDKAAGMICAEIEKLEPKVPSAECTPLVEAGWKKLVAMCPKVETVPPAAKKIEELFCKVASSKMIEDKAAGMICAEIEKVEPKIPSAECTPLVEAGWEKLVTMCSKELSQADFVQGGTLKLSWTDCSDSTYHGKVTALSPSSINIGSNTPLTGAGSLDEQVTGGAFTLTAKAGWITKSYDGDLCTAKTFDLPLGLGSVKWDGLKCPVAKGDVSVGVEVSLSSSIPSSMAKCTIDLKATGASKENLLCMEIKTAPEETIVV